MTNLETRVKKLEAASGLLDDWIGRLSDAELDEEIVRAYAAACDAHGVDDIEGLLLTDAPTKGDFFGLGRESYPMTADIMAMVLKRAGRVFRDECADMSVEQIHSRVKAHIARLDVIKAKSEKHLKKGYDEQH